MTNQNPTVADATTVEVSLDTLSLADYRSSREGAADPATAAAAKDAKAADAHAGGVTPLGEIDAQSGAESTEHADEDDSSGADQKPNKKGGWQRQIEKLRRENDALKQKLAAPAAGAPAADAAGTSDEGKSGAAVAAPALPAFDKAKPTLRDFDSVEAFSDALTDWKLEKRDFEIAQRTAAERQQAEAKAIIDGWNSRQTTARETHADYDDVLAAVAHIAIPPAHQRLLLEDESGPEMAYVLASDPDQLTQFVGLNPIAAARFLGKLEAARTSSAQAAPNKETTKVSSAPKPARSVAGGRAAASVAGEVDIERMSIAEYRKAREAGKLR